MEANKELELFSYGLSHDLRAPVRGVEGYLQIILEDHGGRMDKEGRKLVNMAKDLTGKMNELIDDILSYSNISQLGVLKRQEVSIEKLIEEILGMVNVKSHFPNTRIRIQENLPKMKGDQRMLFQLWSNLINNALKYSAQEEIPEIEIGTAQKNGREAYFISDNGVGIEEKHFDQIFENFTRVAGRRFKGSGIGLAIVKKIIDKHEGEIWVESTLNKGTTFYFYTSACE